jgi:hypothetical protein
VSETWTWASQTRIMQAVEELKATILAKYPEAQFSLSRDPDDPITWDLWTLVNIEDPDEVRDLTRDRELEMLVDEHIPLHVVPTRAPERFVRPAPAQARKTG